MDVVMKEGWIEKEGGSTKIMEKKMGSIVRSG